MHDPFQTFSPLGAYSGMTGALGMNPATLNPLAGGISPFGQQAGIGYGGLIPHLQQQQLQQHLQQQLQQHLLQQQLQQHLQQMQLAAILGQSNPQTLGWQNPLSAIGLLQNPLISQGLQNPLLNPILAQHYQQQYPHIGGVSPFGQIGSPFGQIGSPFGQTGYPLAPQTWIGPQGAGFGGSLMQGNPLLSHLAGRGFQGHGMSPWSGF